MFKKTKGFILGVVVTLVLTMAGTALASTVRNINVTYRDIRIVVDGQEITPRDAQGNVVEPFIFEGTTFLPVRAVAEALGQEVDWDGATNTVYIGGAPTQPTEPPPTYESAPAPQPETFMLHTGTFTVGQDIPAGRYVITVEGSGNFIVHNADERLHVNEVLGRGVASVTADFGNGYQIRISGIERVIFTPAVRMLSTTLTTGHWVVGQDIPAGIYDAIPATGESGNFIVHQANGRLAYNEILGSRVEKLRVNLQNGQTIRISSLSSVSFVAP
ncbi:MAG: copper amine oxidase N-terminal domain-containing protein [Oscillospiraceae bacterium]|nr:copper amine oxidase N-terminal domain-containing protein [Oscillospiraceae bacterium]